MRYRVVLLPLVMLLMSAVGSAGAAPREITWDDLIPAPQAAETLDFSLQGALTGTPTLGLPGFSIPVDTVPGKPMGVQLIAGRYGDRALLNAGAVIERGIGPIAPVDPRG